MGVKGDEQVNKRSAATAHRNAKNAARERDAVGWGGFIDVRLDADQREAFKAWALENESDLFDLAEGLLVLGHKISLSFSSGNDTFVAALTGLLVEGVMERRTASAFAGDATTALLLLLFKHYVLVQGVWANAASLTTRGDEFG